MPLHCTMSCITSSLTSLLNLQYILHLYLYISFRPLNSICLKMWAKTFRPCSTGSTRMKFTNHCNHITVHQMLCSKTLASYQFFCCANSVHSVLQTLKIHNKFTILKSSTKSSFITSTRYIWSLRLYISYGRDFHIKDSQKSSYWNLNTISEWFMS